MAQRELL
jgi:histone-lysine N-methyltransferase SETD3